MSSPPAADTGAETAHKLLKSLEEISRNGGTITADPPPRPYGFRGNTHVNISQELQENLWRFKLTTTARDVLDHMTVTHDDQGIVSVTQTALAVHFECSQSKISRALRQLSQHHFAWKARRGQYRLNPTYAYRFGSKKHHRLLTELGESMLQEHTITIPLPSETRP